MKIINQTTDEMALKDGSFSSLIIGAVLIVIGGYISYSTYASSGFSNNAIWIAVVIFAAGIVTILLSSSITIDINKSGGQIAYQKKRLIGSQSSAYNVADVLRVETRKAWKTVSSSKGGSSQVLVSQSVIVLKDGQEVPLDHQKQSSGFSGILMSGQSKESAVANQVATFLGVPFQEIAPPSARELVEAVREGIEEGIDKRKTDQQG